MKPHLFAQRSGQQISLPNFRLAYLNFRNAYVIFKSPRHFWDQVGIPENHERANPYKLIPYDLGCILKFVRCESHLPHFLAIEFWVFPAIDGHWRVEGASDLDFLEVLQRRQYQSNPKQSKACDEIHVSDIHMLHRWYVYQHLPPTKWFKWK